MMDILKESQVPGFHTAHIVLDRKRHSNVILYHVKAFVNPRMTGAVTFSNTVMQFWLITKTRTKAQGKNIYCHSMSTVMMYAPKTSGG